MKNNSYVYIPVDKLTDLIVASCPLVHNVACPGKRERGIDDYCVDCWKRWLMDGEQE